MRRQMESLRIKKEGELVGGREGHERECGIKKEEERGEKNGREDMR